MACGVYMAAYVIHAKNAQRILAKFSAHHLRPFVIFQPNGALFVKAVIVLLIMEGPNSGSRRSNSCGGLDRLSTVNLRFLLSVTLP